MKKLLLAGSILAAAGLTANAQITSVYGDMILSFYTASGSSVGTNAYEVNLGTATAFRTSAPTGMIVDLGTDLTAAFGAGWASNTDLKMSLVSAWPSAGSSPGTPDAARTIYYTQNKATTYQVFGFGTSVELTDKTTVAPTVAESMSSTAYNGWATAISGFVDTQDWAANGATVTDSAIIPTSSAGDITDVVFPTVANYFGKGRPTANLGDYGNNFVFAVDLWVTDKATSTTGTYLGTFGLNDQGEFGQLTAVPEPSSMLMVSALGLGALAYNRTRRKNASK